MLLRENKSLASAILDLGEQMQKMEEMLRDFCQKYAPINKPQTELETRLDQFLTGVRNASNMGSAEKLQSSAPSSGAQPASGSLLPPTSLPSPPVLPRIYPHTAPPHTAVPTRPSTSQPPPYCRAYSTIHPSSAASPQPLVCLCGREQTRAMTIYTSCAGWWCRFHGS